MSRLSDDQKSTIHTVYTVQRARFKSGSITKQIREQLPNFPLFGNKESVPSRKCVRLWVQKWDANGGKFTVRESRAYTKKARKLERSIVNKVKTKLKSGHSCRKVSVKNEVTSCSIF